MDNNNNNTAPIVFTEDKGSEVEALRKTIQWKQEMLDQINRQYNSLHELASGLINVIKDADNDIDDVKGVMEYDRERWAKHDIDVASNEYEVYATITFNVNLTVTECTEEEALAQAESYLGDHHHFTFNYTPDGIQLDNYDLDEIDVNINN
jgi:hypothetical protein